MRAQQREHTAEQAQIATPLNCDQNKWEVTKLGMEVFPNKRLNNTVFCDFIHSI